MVVSDPVSGGRKTGRGAWSSGGNGPAGPRAHSSSGNNNNKRKKRRPPSKILSGHAKSERVAQPLHSAHAASPDRRCGARQRIRRRASPLQYAWRGAAAAALFMRCTTESAGRARNRSTSFTRSHGEAGTRGAELCETDHAPGPSSICLRHATHSSRMHSLELFGTLNLSLREPTVCAAPARRCVDEASWQLVRSTAPTPSITSRRCAPAPRARPAPIPDPTTRMRSCASLWLVCSRPVGADEVFCERRCASIVTLFRVDDGATGVATQEVRGAHRSSNSGPICPILRSADCSWSLGPRSQTLVCALWRPPRSPACAPACVASLPPPSLPPPRVCAPVGIAEGARGPHEVLDLGPGMMSLCMCMSAELRDPG